MWLTRTSIQRPIACAMFFVAVAVIGYRSYTSMLVERAPRVDLPLVSVSTIYPGARPEEIETLVTDPIEEAVASVNNLKDLSSISREGVSIVSAEFEVGIDLNAALADVRQKVDGAERKLPEDAEKPVVEKFDISAQPVLYVGVTSSRSPAETKYVCEDVFAERFQQVGGVADAVVVGGEDREIEVLVDKGRLDAYGISIDELARAIGGNNIDVPGGNIREPAQQIPVRVLGRFRSVDQLRNARIHIPGNEFRKDLHLYLSDLAEVRDGVADPNQLARINGRESVAITIRKSSEANTVQVADGVRKLIEQLKQEYPDFQFVITSDISNRVREDQHDATSHLILSVLLVVLTVWVFLHDIRGTIIVALAIPTALLATFIPMHFGGLTLNMMTFLGLLVVVGILVDDAIVVLENIYRHLKAGEAPPEAAFNGRTEIGLAAIAITMTDVVVFTPIVFMSGTIGLFFRHFALTVVVATLFSLFVSFSLTPMMASVMYRRGETLEPSDRLSLWFERFFHWLDEVYRRALAAVLAPGSRARTLVALALWLGLVFALCGLGLWVRFAWTQATPMPPDEAAREAVRQVATSVLPTCGALALPLALMLSFNLGLRWCLVTFALSAAAGKALGAAPLPDGLQVAVSAVAPVAIGAVVAFVAGRPAGFWRATPRAAVVFGGFAALVITGKLFAPKLGFEFIPAADESEVAVLVETPVATSLYETDRVVRQIERTLRSYPEVRDVTVLVGRITGGGFSFGEEGPQYATLSVILHHPRGLRDRLRFWRRDPNLRDRSDKDLCAEWRRAFANIPGAKIQAVPVRGWAGASSPLQLEVRGRDMQSMNRFANAALEKLKGMPFILNPDLSWRVGSPEVQVHVDRVRAAELGFSAAQIGGVVRTCIEGNTDYKYREGNDEYDIRIRLAKFDRHDIRQVGDILLGYRHGAPIRVRDVADVGFGLGPNKIERRKRQRRIVISANLTKDMPLGNALRQVLPVIQQIPHEGLTVDVEGESRRMREDQAIFSSTFSLSVILVYILMAMLFESLLHPFTIMFCLPMALVGAIAALGITGMTMSIISVVGFIMLVGLVTKNAILMVDFTNTLRLRGRPRDEALQEAGPHRLRPILMTSLTLLMGLMPVAMKLGGPGTASRAPMAVAVQGGLVLSTLLTLLVIPCLYSIFDDAVDWGRALKNRLLARLRPAEETAPLGD